MATDLEKLVVSLDADIRQLTNKLTKAGVAVESFGKKADRDTAAAGKKIADNLSKATGHGGHGGGDSAGGLSYVQKEEFTHIGKSLADEIAAGASPLRALEVEGGRIVQAFSSGPGGVTGTFKALGSTLAGLASPTLLATGAVLGLGAAAIYVYSSFEEAERAIKLGLLGIGGASGATIDDIHRIGDELATVQGISSSAGRDIALELAKTGKIDVGSIGDVGKLTKGFAAITGTDLSTAGKQLAGIFSDPAAGADKLNAILGTLDSKTRAYIATLAAQGREQDAIKALAEAATPQLTRAAEATGAWARAWDAVKNAAGAAGAVVAHVVDGAPPNEQLGSLQRRLNNEERAQAANLPESSSVKTSRDADIADLRRQIAALQHTVATADKAGIDDTDNKRQVALSGEAADAIKGVNPEAENLKALEDRRAKLKAALDAPGVPDRIEGGAENARAALASLDSEIATLKADLSQGGLAAAAALRQADFAKKKADLDSYAAGLAEINNRYDELLRNARASGNLAALPTLDKARAAAIAAYKSDNDDKAEKQFALPQDFSRIVIGSEGNNAARNPRSSASGIGQFTDATFLDQYKKNFPEQAAVLDDSSILKLKSDIELNKKLIDEYGKEIGLALTKAGVVPSLQNLYLGYHFGVGGAEKLLKADPNASAASVLGPAVAAANPEEVGNRSVGQLVAAVNARVIRNTAGGRSQTAAIATEQAHAASLGQTAAETARLVSVTEQLNDDRERGGELGQRFATASDLIKASSASLTPELAAERAEVLRLADARAASAEATRIAEAESGARKSVSRERDDLGLSRDEASVQNQVRGYGLDPTSGAGGQIAEQLRQIQLVGEVKSQAQSSVEGITHALIEGRDAAEAFHNALLGLTEKIADKAIDTGISALFSAGTPAGTSAATGGGSGLFAAVGKLFGFADGTIVRGPGGGRSDSILARVSAGEAILPADVVRNNNPLVQALIARKYADGGLVGAMPPMSVATRRAGSTSSVDARRTYQIDARGAQMGVGQQITSALQEYDRQSTAALPGRIKAYQDESQ